MRKTTPSLLAVVKMQFLDSSDNLFVVVVVVLYLQHADGGGTERVIHAKASQPQRTHAGNSSTVSLKALRFLEIAWARRIQHKQNT